MNLIKKQEKKQKPLESPTFVPVYIYITRKLQLFCLPKIIFMASREEFEKTSA